MIEMVSLWVIVQPVENREHKFGYVIRDVYQINQLLWPLPPAGK